MNIHEDAVVLAVLAYGVNPDTGELDPLAKSRVLLAAEQYRQYMKHGQRAFLYMLGSYPAYAVGSPKINEADAMINKAVAYGVKRSHIGKAEVDDTYGSAEFLIDLVNNYPYVIKVVVITGSLQRRRVLDAFHHRLAGTGLSDSFDYLIINDFTELRRGEIKLKDYTIKQLLEWLKQPLMSPAIYPGIKNLGLWWKNIRENKLKNSKTKPY